ncbi:hypothetical protein [Enemella evansiae]|uniref:hypothetical protein n=1 Tax=Enemella evansiae TaxID=2016499 RepID=UPI000B95CBD1|nr:hypothetical protein [Enemella evansiae]OYO05424.1 hypothetical protein CGZ97_01455 [Enemella evansiae]OYO20432.1 hypothetical protein BI335_02520 [Enemella evansiae]
MNEVSPKEARDRLADAERQRQAITRNLSHATRSFRIVAFLLLGTALAMYPYWALPRWWILVVLGSLIVGTIASCFDYYGHLAYPRAAVREVLATVAVMVVFYLGMWFSGQLHAAGQPWWISGTPWLGAGILSGAGFWALGQRVGR